MEKDKDISSFINAIGATAEMLLSFYRAIKVSEGTDEEAVNITKAYMQALFEAGLNIK